jgi:hypothetical protein
MVQMTVDFPETMAARIQPLGFWLPVILELSFVGCKTLATATAAEVIEFLSSNPKPEQVLSFHVSDRAQVRLQRLLALNQAGLLGEDEQLELDELQKIEHILVMLKARLVKQEKRF